MYIFFKYMDISVKSCYTEHNEKKGFCESYAVRI